MTFTPEKLNTNMHKDLQLEVQDSYANKDCINIQGLKSRIINDNIIEIVKFTFGLEEKHIQ